MKNTLIAIMVVSFFSVFLKAQAVVPDNRIAEKSDGYFAMLADQGKFSGSLLITRDGKTVFGKSYGLANQEYGIPNTPQTIFRIGSLSKQFTALAIMQLVDKGLLRVEDPVSKFLPDYPNGAKITIHHLLSHTSGIPREKTTVETARFLSARQIVDFEKDIATRLLFEPGSGFHYSNVGYNLLACIMELASKKNFDAYVTENILSPLGMRHTGFYNHKTILPQRAYGYVHDETHQLVTAENDGFNALGCGALYSTVGDLAIWEEKQAGIISEKGLAKIRTPYSKNGTGYGIQVVSEHNQPAYLHTGGLNGYLSYMMRLEKDRVNVIFLANLGDIPLLSIMKDINAILFGDPYQLPQETTRVAVKMDPEKLRRLEGKYRLELDPNQIFTIVMENDRLFMIDPDQAKSELFPESEWRFYSDPKSEDSIEFIVDEKKAVSHMNLIIMGGAKLKVTKTN